MMHLDVFANVERRAPPERLDFESLRCVERIRCRQMESTEKLVRVASAPTRLH